jgi:hypothetical protein
MKGMGDKKEQDKITHHTGKLSTFKQDGLNKKFGEDRTSRNWVLSTNVYVCWVRPLLGHCMSQHLAEPKFPKNKIYQYKCVSDPYQLKQLGGVEEMVMSILS